MWGYVCLCVPENYTVFQILVIFVPENTIFGRHVCTGYAQAALVMGQQVCMLEVGMGYIMKVIRRTLWS